MTHHRSPLFALRLALAAGLLIVAPAARAAEPCTGPLTVLVDRSASMAEHDPLGALRLALGDALQAARAGGGLDAVVPFDARLGTRIPVGGAGWPDAFAAALAGGDRGATALADVLAGLPSDEGQVVVITDAEATLDARALPMRSLAGIVVVGGAAQPEFRDAARARGAAVRAVRSAAEGPSVVRALCHDGGAPRPEPRAAPAGGDVVLISGLGTRTPSVAGATSPRGCRSAPALLQWCAALVADRRRVWVPAAAPGGRGGAVIDTTGPLAANAVALARWWARVGSGRRPLLVGHSMGGLIAHAAVQRGLPATAIVTVGTPHAGSYGADAYFAARAVARACQFSCPMQAAGLLIATTVLRRRFGDALSDLTRERRTRIAPLGAPGVPLATWAGATGRLPTAPAGLPRISLGGGSYVTPNDGIVGVGSASGALAGLRPMIAVRDGAARHSASVPPAGAPTQLGDRGVATWLVATLHALDAPAAGRLAGVGAPPTARPTGQGSPRARWRLAASLRAVTELAPDREANVGEDALIVATAPIGIWCDDTFLPLVPVADGLWFLDLGAFGCRQIRAGAGAGDPAARGWLLEAPAPAGTAAPREEIVVTRERRRRFRVTVRLAAAGQVRVWRGARRLPLRAAAAGREWAGALSWQATVPARGPRELTAEVRRAGRAPLVASLRLP